MKLIGDTTPPGGWKYTQAESGYQMVSMTVPGLRKLIEEHRKSNGYDLSPGWWEVVQVELCLDPSTGYSCLESEPEPERRMEIIDLLRFFRTMREWGLKRGFGRVAPEIAQERARVCKTCPMNTTVKGCTGCHGVVRWVGEYLTTEEAAIGDGKLHNCGVCKCVLSLKVHLPADVIKDSEKSDLVYPSHCWVGKL